MTHNYLINNQLPVVLAPFLSCQPAHQLHPFQWDDLHKEVQLRRAKQAGKALCWPVLWCQCCGTGDGHSHPSPTKPHGSGSLGHREPATRHQQPRGDTVSAEELFLKQPGSTNRPKQLCNGECWRQNGTMECRQAFCVSVPHRSSSLLH